MVARIRYSPMITRAWRQRYEDGETVDEIVDSLAEQGLETTFHLVQRAIKDAGGVLRPKIRRPKDVKKFILS